MRMRRMREMGGSWRARAAKEEAGDATVSAHWQAGVVGTAGSRGGWILTVAGDRDETGEKSGMYEGKGKRFSAAAEEQQMPFLEGGRPRSQTARRANEKARMARRRSTVAFSGCICPQGFWWGTKLT
ncbi:hypothetical protein V8C26DRAFT_351973 [Trichoderma gracile]